MVNKRYEFYKWLSDTTKTLSWVGSAVFTYLEVNPRSLGFAIGLIWYFMGLQILAFKLNLRAQDEKEN